MAENENYNDIEGNYRESNYEKKFGDADPIHNPAAVTAAKSSIVGGAAAIIGGLATFIIAILMDSMYVMLAAFAPVGVVIGFIYAINAIRIDKSVPTAYVGLVLNIIEIIPAAFCTWLLITSLIYY